MDVKIAFFHGDLEEKIFMYHPEGLVASENKRKLCNLDKAIYSFKQAPRDGHKNFDKPILT